MIHKHQSGGGQPRSFLKYRGSRTAVLPILSFLFVILATCRVPAQVLYGSIVGTVTDASGAVVVGADVTVTAIATQEARSGKTNEAGIYSFSNVPSGAYSVVITKSGFQEYQVRSVDVRFNAVTRVDGKLAIGTAQQVVTVNAEGAQLQTDRADVNQDIPSQELQNIPQPSRTYEGMLDTVPGVLPPGVSAGGTVGTNNVDRAMTIQSNGASQSATDVRIEGVDATQPWIPYRSSLVPSIEAIDTVSMVTASADSSQTLSAGATINVQLKSGTNQLHGEAYEYHIDNLWAARNFFQPTGALPKDTDNDLGGTVGGPILKNKLFYFVSYEGDFTSQDTLATLTVPTPAMLSGDFTDPGSGTCPNTHAAPACTVLYDPTSDPTGVNKKSFISEYGSNKIPANMISTQLAPLLKWLGQYAYTPGNPLPSLSASTTYNQNVQYELPQPQHLQKWDTKFDWDASSKLRLTGRFNLHPYELLYPTSGPWLLFEAPSSNHSYGQTTATTVAATYTVTPNFLIDGSWGYTRSVETIDPPGDSVKYAASTLGIPGIQLPSLPAGGGLPNFSFTTYSELGYHYPYLHYNDPIFGYSANATIVHRSNTFKFGILINQVHLNHIEPPGLTGTPDGFTFGGNATTAYGGASSQFNSFADFLLGDPSAWQNSNQPNTASVMHIMQYSAYLSNSQQIGRKLTVNYGTSWEYFPVATHGSYGPENLNFVVNNSLAAQNQSVIVPGSYEICGNQGIPKSCGITSSWALLGPHLGIAYRIAPSFVVRGGASISPEQFNPGRELLYNYPDTTGYSASAANGYVPVGSLSTGLPIISTPSFQSGILALPTGALFNALPQHYKRGYINSWNLTLEKELGAWLFQAGYVGNTAVDLHSVYDINYGQLGEGVQSGAIYKLNQTTATESAILPYEHTNYNSFQAVIQKRLTQGYMIRASYTLSKWLGLCCDVNGFGTLETPIPQYMRLNYTVMPGDRKHDLAITGVAESPFGEGKTWVHSGLGAYILGGWELNASEIVLSGPPVNIGESGAGLFNAPGSTPRPNQNGHVAIHPGNLKTYFDTTPYSLDNAPNFGTSPYDSIRAPGAANLDGSLFRSFSYQERYKLQFRMEALNVTNTPHFAAPASTFNSPGFGSITSTSAISRTVDSRYFRFGAKFIF